MNLQSLTLFSILLQQYTVYVDSIARPHPDFVGYENVHDYRKRNNITFDYSPGRLTHEHCRYLTAEQCRQEDETRKRLKQNRFLNPSTGKFKVLVILVRFRDHRGLDLPPRSHYETLFNGRGESDINPVGSIREYIRINSLGRYDVQFDVQDWRDVPETEAFYAQGVSGRIGNVPIQAMYGPVLDQLDEEGIAWREYDIASEIDSEFGDGQLDHLVVLHSGVGAENGNPTEDCLPGTFLDRIWSQGSGSSGNGGWESKDAYKVGGATIASAWRPPVCNPEPAEMAVIMHEFLHGFKLLDMYDGDKASPGIGGLASFDIMSNAYGWRRNFNLPGHMSAWSKIDSNWLDPIEITQDGYYAIQPAEISSQIYKISAPYPEGEYLLIENRQPMKFDSDWTGSGIVIYHVDEKAPNQNEVGYPGSSGWPGAHYKVAVLQADGNFDIEKGVNSGDAGDFFVNGTQLTPGGSYPNTDAYQGGRWRRTGLSISITSTSGFIMLFRVQGLGTQRARNALSFTTGKVADNDRKGTAWPLKWVVAMISGLAVVSGVAATLL